MDGIKYIFSYADLLKSCASREVQLAPCQSEFIAKLLMVTFDKKNWGGENLAPGFPKTINCTCNIDYKENIVHAIQFTAPHTFTQQNSANLFNAVLGLHIIKSDAAHK
ncbi:hypothetical protein T4C_12816 [Trichinella pseudospiralis]|uniref:Uncharacterized protein n=1 Tax=Trichinella pseudospiralis TaxID=6337 RepID=A0A0V1IY82_TRIPS|nr:hypothetical protein T4C_2547 [Trichinella pseudospiralis]KRZ27695.1 hypothetical protein T4C_12816 [Trichinella pseudospiralis]